MPEASSSVDADSVDSVLVSAMVYLPNQECVPASAKSFVKRVKVRAGGTVAISLGSFTVETNDNTERQDQLAGALAELWNIFVYGGFWRSPVMENAEVTVSISLTPVWGQAGISISPGSLQHWLEAGAHLQVNAYSQD